MALLTTAALDNSHHMDFSINPQINICSGREYTHAGYEEVSSLHAGDQRTQCCGCPAVPGLQQADLCFMGMEAGKRVLRLSVCRACGFPRDPTAIKKRLFKMAEKTKQNKKVGAVNERPVSSHPALPPTFCVTGGKLLNLSEF